MLYRDLVEDGHISGLLVAPDWWEPKHPQEDPVTVNDPVALWRPAPELSRPLGELTGPDYGQDNRDIDLYPTTPPVGAVCSTITSALVGGETMIALETAISWTDNPLFYIELSGGGYFRSFSTVPQCDLTYTVPLYTPFLGAANASAQICFSTVTL